MIRDNFSRDTQGAMGNPTRTGSYYHLYIDGVYWGLYQTDERMKVKFSCFLHRRRSGDYDTMKPVDGYTMGCVDGHRDAYHRLWQATMDGFSTMSLLPRAGV